MHEVVKVMGSIPQGVFPHVAIPSPAAKFLSSAFFGSEENRQRTFEKSKARTCHAEVRVPYFQFAHVLSLAFLRAAAGGLNFLNQSFLEKAVLSLCSNAKVTRDSPG